jgi:hypothetical protein
VNYNRYFGPWQVTANFDYDQAVQTLYALYTTSSLEYGASVYRKLRGGFRLQLGAGGGHSGFVQQAGTVSKAEDVNGSIGWRRYNLSGGYSQSSGQSVVTPNGLVILPVPIVPLSDIVVFDGKSMNGAFSGSPLRNMSLTVAYARGTSTSVAPTYNSFNTTNLYNGYMTYRFRKLYFVAGATKFEQKLIGPGGNSSVITSYYFGISRWFKFF